MFRHILSYYIYTEQYAKARKYLALCEKAK